MTGDEKNFREIIAHFSSEKIPYIIFDDSIVDIVETLRR